MKKKKEKEFYKKSYKIKKIKMISKEGKKSSEKMINKRKKVIYPLPSHICIFIIYIYDTDNSKLFSVDHYSSEIEEKK
jgi:hypothetical protein